jgi:hypothetical protein
VLRLAVRVIEAVLGEDAISDRLFVDVGANIGTATVCALGSQGFGSAVCCEPGPENFRLLEANLALNGFSARARAFNVAATNRLGRSTFAVVPDRSGKGWIGTEKQIAAGRPDTRRKSPRTPSRPQQTGRPEGRARDHRHGTDHARRSRH